MIWPPDAKSLLIWKDPDDGKGWGQKEKRAAKNEIDSITNSMDMNLSKLQEIVENRGVWCTPVHGSLRVGHDLVTDMMERKTLV